MQMERSDVIKAIENRKEKEKNKISLVRWF